MNNNEQEKKQNPKTKQKISKSTQAEKYPLENAETMEPSPAVDGPGGGRAIASGAEGGLAAEIQKCDGVGMGRICGGEAVEWR